MSTTQDANIDTYNVDPADGHAEINSIITQAGNNAIIRIGAGECVGTGITLEHGINIIGAGRNATTLKLEDGANTDVITTPDPENRNVMMCSIADLTVDGNRDNNSSGHGLYGAIWNGRFRDVDFKNCPENGAWVTGGTHSTDDCVFNGCRFVRNGNIGVKFGESKQGYQASGVGRVTDCFMGNNGGRAAKFRGNAMQMKGCKVYSSGSSGGALILFDRCSFAKLANCDLYQSEVGSMVAVIARNGVDVENVQIRGNDIRNMWSSGVLVYADGNDVSGVQVHDNVFNADEAGETGINAFGSGTFTKCSARNNTFLNTDVATDLPVGWVESGTL